MKRIVILGSFIFATTLSAFAQGNGDDYKPHFGIKAGYNIAGLAGSSPNFKPDPKNGFMAAAFYSRQPKSGMGYRTELVFSRQGFGFDQNGQKEDVTNDYVYMPHFTTFGITRFAQLHIGIQAGYLLRSSKTNNASKTEPTNISELYNRLDYGAAGGLEIFPFKGLILGGRYNLGFGKLYKDQPSVIPPMPLPTQYPFPFKPSELKKKNAVINFYVGYRF